MNRLIDEMSTLIGDKFVDVFDHIRELEGRKALTVKEVEHHLLIQLMTSDVGAEIFETNKLRVVDPKWPQTVKGCFEEKVIWETWKNAFLDE